MTTWAKVANIVLTDVLFFVFRMTLSLALIALVLWLTLTYPWVAAVLGWSVLALLSIWCIFLCLIYLSDLHHKCSKEDLQEGG